MKNSASLLTLLIPVFSYAFTGGTTPGINSLSDTTKFKIGGATIIIVDDDNAKNDSSKSVNAIEIKSDTIVEQHDNEKKKKKRSHDDASYWGGLGLGMNGYMNNHYGMNLPDGYEFLELNAPKSVGVSLRFADVNINLMHNRLHLVTGLGFEWNNYRFEKNITLIPGADSIFSIMSPNALSKNKLTVSYLEVPLLLGFNTRIGGHEGHKGKHFTFAAGIIGGVRLGSHTKQVFDKDNQEFKYKIHDDFNLNPFKYDATIKIGLGDVAIFGNYSLSTMFKSQQGPKLHPYTVGLIFG